MTVQVNNDGSAVRRRAQYEPLESGILLLFDGIVPTKENKEQDFEDRHVQLYQYPPDITQSSQITGLIRIASNSSNDCNDFLITQLAQSVMINNSADKSWEVQNLYDSASKDFKSLWFKDSTSVRMIEKINKRKLKQLKSFVVALFYAGVIENVPQCIGDILWMGIVELVFDVHHNVRSSYYEIIRIHHGLFTREIILAETESFAADATKGLIRWKRPELEQSVKPVNIFTKLEVWKWSTYSMMFDEFQIKIEAFDIMDRTDGILFLRCIEDDKLLDLCAALNKLGLTKIQMDPKVDARQGGKKLWSGKVQIDLSQSLDDPELKWHGAMVFTYPETKNEECIGVLEISGWGNGVTYINLNDVMFSKGSEESCEVTLRNFNVVQKVVDGKASDVTLDQPLTMRVIGFFERNERGRIHVLFKDGPDGVDALYDALTKAGANEIAY